MLLVLINPQSGVKAAPKVFKESIRPQLNTEFEAYETIAPLHATELTKKHFIKYSQARDIMILGGDGLIHEVIKGIYDLELIPEKIQLWIIPCGSGNALAMSVGVYSPQDGISRFLKKETLRKLVIYDVSNSLNNQLTFMDYCFCVISYGFHTQVVRQSEWLRFLGPFRFQLAALWNLLFFKTYKCEFKILNDSSDNSSLKNFQYFIATKVDYLDKGFRVCNSSNISSNQFDLISLENVSRSQVSDFLRAASCEHTASTYSLEFITKKKAEGFTFKPCISKRWNRWSRVVHDICVDGEIFQVPDGSCVIVKPLKEIKQIIMMVVFWKNPQQKFQGLRKRLRHEIELLAIIVLLLVIIVPIVGVYNAKEGDRKGSSVIQNYGDTSIQSDNFNGVFIEGYVSFIDPNNYNYRLNLRFYPSGNYSQDLKGQTSVPMMFKINGIRSEVTDAFDVIPPQDFLFTFSEGSATEYPFESYTDSLTIVATATIGNETLDIPIAFEYATFLQGWDLSADILSPNLAPFLESETYFRRSKTSKFFSIFINMLMWLLSLFLLAMVIGIWYRNRSVEPPTLAFNAALLFAIPAIRQVQPGVPTIGCIADAVGFFWCMAIVAGCQLALMMNYIVKYQPDPTKEFKNEKSSEGGTSVPGETPVVVSIGSE